MPGCLRVTCVSGVVQRMAQPATGVRRDAHFQRPVELDPCDMMHFGRGEIKVLQGGFAMCHGVYGVQY